MPVTARLSRRFYEKFGDEIVNELVEWLNQVDATYRSELREINELNFARFDANLNQRMAELRAELNQRMAEMGADLSQRMAGMGAELSQRIAESRGEARTESQALKAELIKWMFLFWAGSALGGLLLR